MAAESGVGITDESSNKWRQILKYQLELIVLLAFSSRYKCVLRLIEIY